jgi:tetratricopeptide (TPR) repeat protein
MHIKRDYQTPFFRRKERPNRVKQGFYGLLLLIMIAAGVFITQRPDEARAMAMQVIGPEMTPTPLPSEIARQGLDLYFAGDLEGAAEMFAQAVEQRPDSVSYLYELGQVLIDLGRPDEALQIATDILDIAPSDPRGYALRARGMVWEGNSNGAVTVALAGLDIDPTFGALYAALSRAYVGEGRWRESQEAGLQAIEYAPDDVHSYWAYASALAQVGAHDEARREYERAIDVNPTFTPPYFELAFIHLAQGRDQEAIELYDRVLGMHPRHSQALLRKCEAYRKVGEFERSLGLCQDAVAADPDNTAARYRLGVLLYNDFSFEDAREQFDVCLNQDPDNALCTLRMGLTDYYIARDIYRIQCEANGIAPGRCEQSIETCRSGWNLLQDALLLVSEEGGFQKAGEDIRQGLSAIASDPACAGVSGRRVSTPLPPPATPGPQGAR